MSFQLVAWAVEQQTPSSTSKFVLLMLASRANHDNGLCCPKISSIAKETQLGEKTVKRALATLCESGFISRKRERREDGTLGVYHYAFNSSQRSDLSQPGVKMTPDPGITVTPSPGVKMTPQEPGSKTYNQEEDPNQVAPRSSDLVATSSAANDNHPPPPLLLIEGRNLGYDALAEATGVVSGSPRHKEVAVALNGQRGREGIRALLWKEATSRRDSVTDVGIFEGGEVWERALAEEVRHRAEMYRQRMPEGTMITPTALLKWWMDLPSMESSGSGYKGVSVQDILKMTGVTQ